MSLKALIFDVDGTLAETEELHREAFNEAFAAAGYDWHWDEDLYRRLLKVTGGKERIRHFLGTAEIDIGPDAADTIAALHAVKNERYARKVAAGIALRPGILRLMREAADEGLQLAIATTTSRSNLDALLASALGADEELRFAAIVTGEDVERKKPDPEAYLVVLQRLGLAAEECVAFEDSRNGVLAAQGAGLPVVVTPGIYTAHESFDGAECIVSDLGEPGQPLRLLGGWRPAQGVIDLATLRSLNKAGAGELVRG